MDVKSEINIFEIACFVIMQAYVPALNAWGLFNYMLYKYDLFIAVVCSVILIIIIIIKFYFRQYIYIHTCTVCPYS